MGELAPPAPLPPRVPTKLGVVFPNPQRDWHGHSGWVAELTYAHQHDQPYWGVDALAQRVARDVRQGQRVIVRVDFAQGQALPPAGDEAALAEYLAYLQRLARDDRLQDVYALQLGSGYNAAGANSAPPAILFISAYDHPGHLHRAYRSGALGYLLKEAPMEQVARAVKRAGEGLPCWREEQLARIRLWEEEVAAAWASLTTREQEIARLLAQGLRNQEIADTLGVSVRTVEYHVTNVLGKLGLRSRAEIAGWLAGVGELLQK